MKMILLLGLTCLAAVQLGSADVKGGPHIVPAPLLREPQVLVEDIPKPFSLNYELGGPYARRPIVGPYGHGRAVHPVAAPLLRLGKGAVVGARHPLEPIAQVSDSGVLISKRPDPLYRTGLSPVPFGLSGLDFYSYPSHLHAAGRAPLGGIGPFAVAPAAVKGGHVAVKSPVFPPFAGPGPSNIHFSLGGPHVSPVAPGPRPGVVYARPAPVPDPHIVGPAAQLPVPDPFISRRIAPNYRIGQSPIPFGLSGLDFYSYPANLHPLRGVKTAGIARISPFARHAGPVAVKSAVLPPFAGPSPIHFSLGGPHAGGVAPFIAGRKGGVAFPGPAVKAAPIPAAPFIGPESVQLPVADPFVSRRLYRTGMSPIPFGLSGLDFYSYPANLRAPRPVLSKSTGGVISPFARPAVLPHAGPVAVKSAVVPPLDVVDPIIAGRKGGVAYAPIGIGGAFGRRRPAYPIGRSRIPFGFSGLDYYSYPEDLRFGRRRIAPFLHSDIQQSIPEAVIGQEKIAAALDPIAQGPVQLAIGDPAWSPRRIAYRTGHSPVPFGLSGFDYYSYPHHLLSDGGRKGLPFSRAHGGIVSPFARRHPAPGILRNVHQEIIDGPHPIQFKLGDQQAKIASGFGPAYRGHPSRVPFGITGLDYYSYPAPRYISRLLRPGGPHGVQEHLGDVPVGPGPTLLRHPIEQRNIIATGDPRNIHFTLGVASGIAGGFRRAGYYGAPFSGGIPIIPKPAISPLPRPAVLNFPHPVAPPVPHPIERGPVAPFIPAGPVAGLGPAGLLYGQRTIEPIDAFPLAGPPHPAPVKSIHRVLGDPGHRIPQPEPLPVAPRRILPPHPVPGPVNLGGYPDFRVPAPAFERPYVGLPRPAPVRVAQEVVPAPHFAFGGPGPIGVAPLPPSDLIRTVKKENLLGFAAGPGPERAAIAHVRETIAQRPVGIIDGPSPFRYTPRMSYLSQHLYDAPFEVSSKLPVVFGRQGAFGLRTSPIRPDVAFAPGPALIHPAPLPIHRNLAHTADLPPKPIVGPHGLVQEKIEQIFVR